MASENKAGKNDTVGLFLQAMVDREPGKRKVKPSKAALVDLAELDLGESSDDSDFNVDEAKLNDDDDISINSDPDAPDDDDDDDGDDDVDEEGESEEEAEVTYAAPEKNLTVTQLLEQAKKKQALEAEKGFERPKILVCSVCLGDHSDDLNEIVTCDGCSVSVHEGCYGISDSVSVSSTVSSCSTEPWFCDACKAGVVDPPCELCPNLGYTIFKETEMGRWVHLVCALYIPGVAFSEVDKLSFPTLFEMPYSKWGAKTCTLCEDERYSRTGVCIGCDAGMCRGYFHVTCAQREGLLSEVNHGEADQADPYYAHCKLHTDRELIRRRKRNWLALQLHMKQGEADKSGSSQETQDRIQRKLGRYRDKYLFNKNNRPTPWYPTQKMPRALSTSASLFRSLLHKTELMGLSTESQPLHSTSVGDIRKKWHIPPAFNVEFISYYLDRTNRLTEMKDRLDRLLTENSQLIEEETQLRIKCNQMESECENFKSENDVLLNKALELHDLLKGLAGRPLPLPPVVAALHNPPSPPLPTRPLPKGSLRGPIITKAAAKMMTDHAPPVGEMGTNSLTLNRCRVCQLTKEQHLLIECDTCGHYYHLSCLDPPLTRMPKKTKQMGWQCSDCCKSSDSDKAPEVDTAAPRRLRRNIKEPAKFSPSLASETKGIEGGEKSQIGSSVSTTVTCTSVTPNTDDKPPIHLYHPGVASVAGPPEESSEAANIGGKRRRSSDGKKAATKKQKKSPGDIEHSSSETVPVSTMADPIPANKMSPTTATARGKKGPQDMPGQDALQTSQLETRSSRGRKVHPEPPSPVVSVHCTMSTAAPTITTTSLPEKSIAAVTQNSEISSPCKNRRGQGDSTQPPIPTQATSSPSRQRRQPLEAGEAQSRPQISSPTRSRRHQTESNAEGPAETQQAIPTSAESETNQSSGGLQTSLAENTEANSRRRGASSIQLDTSVESLPSVTSLHSPTSESFHSAEDDPSSPRKEKRHRDGSKKKKKDKDKELDGVKKRKKHHHRDKHGMGEMASEILTPFRIKIKPLPPRPMDEMGLGACAVPPAPTTSQTSIGSVSSSNTTTTTAAVTTSSSIVSSTTSTSSTTAVATSSTTSTSSSTMVTHSNYQTRTPPAGYPPLPPGYTLTQPMAPPSSTPSSTNTSSSTATSTHYSTTTSSQASTSHANTFSTSGGSSNRRRSDPSDPQQFSKCDVCGETGGVTNTVSCDECNKAYHFNCLEPPLKKSPKRRGYSWFCEDCDSAVSTINLAHIQWNINAP
ncbi:uncharacterized protein LOC123499603 isoform X2 [Portunus trituberculatus]|uniref:uncharacterized protein LOC123499603 isoform X2 n=1 Tax=Portunus trituberculatus TaxID=210409 RepID=UPI001E1CFFF1|nr:uncharacterized protein LOC123499603 isoform X2 [Portunus trituberculatus]